MRARVPRAPSTAARRRHPPAGALAAVLLVLGGCGTPDAPPADAVATLGAEDVSYRAFAEFVEEQTDSSPAALEATVLSSLLDQLLDERLLLRMATDRGLLGDGEGSASGEAGPSPGRRRALAALVDASPQRPPSDEALRARYREAEERFTLPERVRLRQILTESRDRAEAAAAELAGGAGFAEVARRFSVDPSAPFGGRQGELARADLPEEFADILFSLEPGEVSDIVEADYGFHIFQVTERLPERTVPFEEAAPDLRRQLLAERAEVHVSELVAAARNRYTVRVYEDHLSFDYRGVYPTSSTGDPPAEP